MSITKAFEESEIMDLVDAELGGQNYLLIKGLFDHARSLETMLKKHERGGFDQDGGDSTCIECGQSPHADNCQLAKLLEGVE